MNLLDNVLFMASCMERLLIGQQRMPILLCLCETPSSGYARSASVWMEIVSMKF